MIQINRTQAQKIISNYYALASSKKDNYLSQYDMSVWTQAFDICADSISLADKIFGQDSEVNVILPDELVSLLLTVKTYA
ncbi:hypothetical protein AVV36_gp014 [Pectobacterium bacteriophage PM2]|uniref:Uncharacterized protein n=1 Tax=Pectobacterium bacteriophage PM2 TaxID=1429794 RepID=A0A0A0Q095_9CAUD|nr:hypothetical protein AVV36_gp014 [Pectobacterium bacteriophage PM2]AHY24976.1 hypothetical protein PM2_014 [Pectobacterium bacteriophage PM2]